MRFLIALISFQASSEVQKRKTSLPLTGATVPLSLGHSATQYSPDAPGLVDTSGANSSMVFGG